MQNSLFTFGARYGKEITELTVRGEAPTFAEIYMVGNPVFDLPNPKILIQRFL